MAGDAEEPRKWVGREDVPAPPSHSEGLGCYVLGRAPLTEAPQRIGQYVCIVSPKAGLEPRFDVPICGSTPFAYRARPLLRLVHLTLDVRRGGRYYGPASGGHVLAPLLAWLRAEEPAKLQPAEAAGFVHVFAVVPTGGRRA
jgi:hypothetical protein